MKRYIFIVDDDMTDISGYLLTLQVVLGPRFAEHPPEDLKDISICFLHICWHDDECAKTEYTSRFNNAFQHIQRELKANDLPTLCQADYKCVALDGRDYCSDSSDKQIVDALVNKIIDVQKEYLRKQNTSKKFLAKFPNTSSEDATYVLLLDIILNQSNGIDQSRMQKKWPVLSSGIYARFPKERCITYTNYQGYYGDEWAALANVINSDKQPIRRELLTRPRAIYIPFRDRLYRALDL